MTDEEIRQGLADILEEVGGAEPSEVQMDKSFINDLDIDSLLLVEIIVAAEERFGVSISDDDMSDGTTVGDLVRRIQDTLATEGTLAAR